jgi:hypothetical protein
MDIGIAFFIACLTLLILLFFEDSSGASTSEEASTIDNGITGTGGALNTIANTIAGAIKKAEGFFPGSVSQRDNNPGNMEIPGDTGLTDSAGHGIFSSLSAGMTALIEDITHKLSTAPEGTTLEGLLSRYVYGTPYDSPASSTALDNYVNIVAESLSNVVGFAVDATTQISDLVASGG